MHRVFFSYFIKYAHCSYLSGLDSPGFDSWLGKGVFVLFDTSKPTVFPTQPHIQFLPWLMRAEREADHLPPLVPRLRMSGAVPSRLFPLILRHLLNVIFL